MPRNYKDISGENNHNYKTGLKVKGSPHAGIYNSWQNMKKRCLNPNNPKYPRYGGRGIKICAAWMEIKHFYKWALSFGWKQGMCIDRINNDGDYEPENCRWVSVSENSRKKSTTKLTREDARKIRSRAANGECEYDLAEEYGVCHGTIWFVVKNITHTVDGNHSKAKREIRKKSKNA